jgi:hypothetical protein
MPFATDYGFPASVMLFTEKGQLDETSELLCNVSASTQELICASQSRTQWRYCEPDYLYLAPPGWNGTEPTGSTPKCRAQAYKAFAVYA